MLREENLATLFESIADVIPTETALRHEERSVSWLEFDDTAARLANALQVSGVLPGAKVAIAMYNCPEWLESFYGSIKARTQPANVNYRYRDAELKYLLEDSEAEAVIFHASLADGLNRIRDTLPKVRLWIAVDDIGNYSPAPGVKLYHDVIAAFDPAQRIERPPTDSFLSYTGGTTGMPKGVISRLDRFAATGATWAGHLLGAETPQVETVAEMASALRDSGKRIVALPASPLMHSAALGMTALATLAAGGEVVTVSSYSFDPHAILRAIDANDVMRLTFVGDAMARPLLEAMDAREKNGDPFKGDSLRAISSAGVAWTQETKNAIFHHLPHVILLDYCGASEGVQYGSRTTRKSDLSRSGNFDPVAGLILLDENGAELPKEAGVSGLLAAPSTASGYYKDSVNSKKVFFARDGRSYAAPGDYGRWEADGTITLVGRSSNVINTGGEKVHPEEVEHVIMQIQGVEDVLIFGMPDSRLGQRVSAVIQMAIGAEYDETAIIDHVRDRVASYKAPRQILRVDCVPRSPNGKGDYATSRDLMSAAMTSADERAVARS